MKIKGLEPDDNRFIYGAKRLMVSYGGENVTLSDSFETGQRWTDWVEERSKRGMESKNGDLFLVKDINDHHVQSNCLLKVHAKKGKFAPWVTTRPAFEYQDGSTAPLILGNNYYSLGSAGVCNVEDGNDKYVLFSIRNPREVDGFIDLPPTTFLHESDMNDDDPCFCAIDREMIENIAEAVDIAHDGVSITDEWRNLNGVFDIWVSLSEIENNYAISEQSSNRDYLQLERRELASSKYESLFLVPEEKVCEYVTSQGHLIGGRSALFLERFLKRYFDDQAKR